MGKSDGWEMLWECALGFNQTRFFFGNAGDVRCDNTFQRRDAEAIGVA